MYSCALIKKKAYHDRYGTAQLQGNVHTCLKRMRDASGTRAEHIWDMCERYLGAILCISIKPNSNSYFSCTVYLAIKVGIARFCSRQHCMDSVHIRNNIQLK